MTNLEWLEECKETDIYYSDEYWEKKLQYRQVRALEIIAEELTRLNEPDALDKSIAKCRAIGYYRASR